VKEIIVSGESPVLMPREDPAGKIIFAIVLLIFVLFCFVALMTFLAAVFRDTNERSKEAVQRSPLRTLLAGIGGYLVFGGLAVWLFSEAFIVRLLETEIVRGYLIAAVLVTAVPVLASLHGAPGLFSCIGDRIAMLHGGDMNGLRRTVFGTLSSVFAALFPFIGWFIIALLA